MYPLSPASNFFITFPSFLISTGVIVVCLISKKTLLSSIFVTVPSVMRLPREIRPEWQDDSFRTNDSAKKEINKNDIDENKNKDISESINKKDVSKEKIEDFKNENLEETSDIDVSSEMKVDQKENKKMSTKTEEFLLKNKNDKKQFYDNNTENKFTIFTLKEQFNQDKESFEQPKVSLEKRNKFIEQNNISTIKQGTGNIISELLKEVDKINENEIDEKLVDSKNREKEKETITKPYKKNIMRSNKKLKDKSNLTLTGQRVQNIKSEINETQKESRYGTLNFIKDFRKELERIIPSEMLWGGRLPNKKFSEILGQSKNHIRIVMRESRFKPNYQIALDFLDDYEKHLISKFSDNSENLITLIKKYQNSNDLPKSTKEHIYKYHPNIDLDYFKNINTKEKAYWLGFINADGSVYRPTKHQDFIRFGLSLSKKDEILIDKFAKAINFNLQYKKDYTKINKKTGKSYKMIKIEFANKRFTDHLKKYGVIPNKVGKINLPDLGNPELNLALLHGFYDGDGTAGTTRITSKSRKFLEQVKERYKIPFKIRELIDKDYVNYQISLGAKLFNKMMSNYRDSLLRKRKLFIVNKFKTHELSKDMLENLIWKMPSHIIARKFDLSQSTITRLYQKYGVKPPPTSYWVNKDYPDKEKEKTFQEFMKFLRDNSGRNNQYYYEHFPYNAPSTIRVWISRARKLLKKNLKNKSK